MNQIIQAIRTLSVTMPAMFMAITWASSRHLVRRSPDHCRHDAHRADDRLYQLSHAGADVPGVVSMMVTFLARSQASSDRIMEVLKASPRSRIGPMPSRRRRRRRVL